MKRKLQFFLLFMTVMVSLRGNEVKVVQAFEMIGGSSVSLARSEWKKYLNPDAKVPMEYSIFKVRIKGNADAVKKAKSSFKLDLGSQLMVKDTYTGNANEIWFLVPAKAKLVYLICGDGCKECLIWDRHIIPDKVYYGEVEFTVEMEGEYVSRQKAANQWFILNFEPKNAMVEVDGTVVDCGDGIYKKALSCGSHVVRVSAKNYHDKVEKVIIDPSEAKKLTISLKPAFGWIEVKKPKGANVFVDNEKIGVAPIKSEPIASGQHDLRVTKENWLPYREQVLVNDNSVTTVNPHLVANFVTIVLKTGNNGEIWVNGEKRGEGSVSVDLSPGEYTFESRKASHHSQSIARTITLSSVGTIDIPSPVAITGSLSVDVEPMGAKVYVDDRYIGEAPLIMNDILVGKHKVKAIAEGLKEEEKDVEITEGKTIEVSIVMKTSLVDINDEGERYYKAGNYAKAVEWYRKAADQGYARAQCNLGVCYDKGNGVEQSYAKAVEWYRKAADQGYARAQCNLGYCCDEGNGVEQSYAKAVEWYRKAADQGYANAQCNLGYCYHFGEGVEQSYTKAVEWYRKAADQGDAGAQCNLGYCYYFGNGVEQSYTKAVEWYRKAADQGDARAQCNLGDCYENGMGVERNFTKAVEWYRKAADQGDATGQCNLGRCYAEGTGVEQSYAKAVEWYRKAADQGYIDARNALERLNN